MRSKTTALGEITKLRSSAAVVASVAILAALCTPSYADVVSSITADLTNSGVPGAQVSVQTPAPASTPLNEVVTGNLVFDAFKPYFSDSYAAPKPVVRVNISTARGKPLKGILTTPGFSQPPATDLAPKLVLWRLAALEAVKHAVAAGANVAALETDVSVAGNATPSKVLSALPNTNYFPPKQEFSSLMPVAAVRDRVAAMLPPWAQTAQLAVRDDYAGERIVTVTARLPIQAFAVTDVYQLTDALAAAQAQLVNDGGNIGRTIAEVFDSSTGDPLFVSADDRSWGYRSAWASPLVVGWLDGPRVVSAAKDALGKLPVRP